MKFETSEESYKIINDLFPRISARNQAIVGRLAVFIALNKGIPSDYKIKDSKGTTLNDEQVIGDDLKEIVKAAINYRCGMTLDESNYRKEFRKYFEYGCYYLKMLWEQCGKDRVKFIKILLDEGGKIDEDRVSDLTILIIINKEVKLKLFDNSEENNEEWSINGPGTKNGLLIISGEPGSGKSQLALDLLVQLSEQNVRFLFFDLKGELEENPNNYEQTKNRNKFFDLTGAKYIKLIKETLPINPLNYISNDIEKVQLGYEIAYLIRCFAPQLGAKQEQNIAEAFKRVKNPDFVSLTKALEETDESGVNVAIFKKINDLKIFETHEKSLSPEEWLSNSLVIDFKGLHIDNTTKSLIVALLLNFLMKKMNQNLPAENGIQPLKMVLFVDEAHLLLPKEGKSGLLSSLARQGRSWGFPLWLASQDVESFETTGNYATNFIELSECGVHFSPHTLSTQQQKKIFGFDINQKLKKGEAIIKFPNGAKIGKVRQFWKNY